MYLEVFGCFLVQLLLFSLLLYGKLSFEHLSCPDFSCQLINEILLDMVLSSIGGILFPSFCFEDPLVDMEYCRYLIVCNIN